MTGMLISCIKTDNLVVLYTFYRLICSLRYCIVINLLYDLTSRRIYSKLTNKNYLNRMILCVTNMKLGIPVRL